MKHETPECFGTMFPCVLHLPDDRPACGKVFTVLLERAGGMMRSQRTVTADKDAWRECSACEEFENCYRFCMAKLTLESAIHDA
jgi:radical SAM protein with 4Fe4S-binding SPASM domain